LRHCSCGYADGLYTYCICGVGSSPDYDVHDEHDDDNDESDDENDNGDDDNAVKI